MSSLQTKLPHWVKKIGFMVLKPKAFWDAQNLARRRQEYKAKAQAGEIIETTFAKDVTIRLHPRGEIVELIYTSDFESDLIAQVIDFLKPGMTVLDVGANCGLYSFVASQCVGKKGTVWAFEPASDMVKLFRDNQKANQAKAVELFQMALGDKANQKVTLLCESGRGDGYRFVAFKNQTKPKATHTTVEVVTESTLDALWAERGKPNVDFIKIDVEGGEYRVMKGARAVLKSNPNIVILFENSPFGLKRAGDTAGQMYRYLADLGFYFLGFDTQTHRWLEGSEATGHLGNIWATRNKLLVKSVTHE